MDFLVNTWWIWLIVAVSVDIATFAWFIMSITSFVLKRSLTIKSTGRLFGKMSLPLILASLSVISWALMLIGAIGAIVEIVRAN